MDAKELRLKRAELEKQRESLEQQIHEINKEITRLTNLEKPYVANVSAYSGHYSMQFKTEEQARKKLDEYATKIYFKNGLNYGVYLYKWNEDETKTLLETIPMGRKNFKVDLS